MGIGLVICLTCSRVSRTTATMLVLGLGCEGPTVQLMALGVAVGDPDVPGAATSKLLTAPLTLHDRVVGDVTPNVANGHLLDRRPHRIPCPT